MTDERLGPGTYMTPEEAKEFHSLFTISMGVFVLIAVIAHFLVWQWRPWFPGTAPYKAGMAATAPIQAPVAGKA
ncbi:light-harvesting antenna LH1, beta subunit [Sphingomonas aquatica]|uniref:light-harvesting antenna LH1, beta subunit n=2 Tax=Sphingomonas TaxID=13687 RepID=UPI00082C3624